MPILRMVRAEDFGSPDEAGQGKPLPIVAATAGEKQDGLDISKLPWDFSRGKATEGGRTRFPLLWAHDFGGRRLPIGVVDVGVGDDDASLSESDAIFDPADEFAVRVERKYRSPEGGLSAFSISWEEVDADGMLARKTGKEAVANQLFEVSAVPIPVDNDALAKEERIALRALRAEIDAVLADGDDTELGCYVPDVTRDADGNVATPSEGADGADGKRVIPGSFEELRARIEEAIWDAEVFPDASSLWVVSTLPDYVIVSVWTEGEREEHFRLDYTEEAGVFEFGTPEPVELNVNYSVSERTADPNGAMPTGSDYDALVRGGAAGAMLAVFDPATEWTDAERRERYNWACVLYRWLGLEAPEFVERAELDALDTEAIRALFLAGEERIGKELSARNIKRLNEIRADVVKAGEGLTDLLARVTGDGEEDTERGDVYADVLRGLSDIGD